MDTVSFGSRLRSLREGREETLAQVAFAVDLAQGTIWRYEKDEQEPGGRVLSRLADHFGVTVDHLLGRDTAPQPSEAAA